MNLKDIFVLTADLSRLNINRMQVYVFVVLGKQKCLNVLIIVAKYLELLIKLLISDSPAAWSV